VGTPSQRLICVLAASVLAASCSQPDDPPSFVGLELWEGYLANPGVPVLQRRVDAMPDGTFVLRRDTLHLARVTVRTSGRADRCLFRPFFYSWSPPTREYECHPEVQDGPMTIDVGFGTWARDLSRTSDYFLLVQLYEHGAERQLIAIYDTRRFEVRFSD
jgi:hypothetical protein